MTQSALRGWRFVALLVLVLGTAVLGQAQVGKEKIIDGKMLVTANHLDDFCERCTIGGMIYDSNFTVIHWFEAGPNWAVLDIRGWDHFVAAIGFPDSDDKGRQWDHEETVTIEVDGTERWRQKVRYGDKAFMVDIPITGARSMRISVTNGPIALAEAKVTRGKPAPSFLLAQTVQLLIDLRTSAAQGKNDAVVKYIDKRLEDMGIVVTVAADGTTTWHLL